MKLDEDPMKLDEEPMKLDEEPMKCILLFTVLHPLTFGRISSVELN